MCGILFYAQFLDQDITSNLTGFQDHFKKLQDTNSARGPDAQRAYGTYVKNRANFETTSDSDARSTPGPGLVLEFFASELRLRGHDPIVQPHLKDGDVFCWNGEIFEGMDIARHENDGVRLFDSIRALGTPEELPTLFGRIEGPYAFVFYHVASCRLYFARDPLGRRSLLLHKPTLANPHFILASVSIGSQFECDFVEVSTDSIFCVDVLRMSNSTNAVAEFDSYVLALPRRRGDPAISSLLNYAEPSRVNTSLPPEDLPRLQSLDHIPDFLSPAVNDLIFHLDRSVMLQVKDIPQSSDAKGQARLAVLFSGGIDSTIITYLAHRHLPIDEPIDLLNVAFENPRKLQVQAEGNVGGFAKKKKREWDRETTNGKKISSGNVSYLVPDRVSGLQEVAELRRLCPGRRWNFIEVNVPYEESQGARQTIEELMWPGRTVMDLSLSMALYFASRGAGRVRSSPDAPSSEIYTSPARVLLNGLGSDELLGGYGRHRSAFNTGGWKAVIDELQLEIDRIPTRNLGRDDRVVSSHGKETRHPFLSLAVVSFLARLPVQFKMDPRLDVGLGDKMLLRLATRKIGLIEASGRKKRAMQFGSHSARMDEGE